MSAPLPLNREAEVWVRGGAATSPVLFGQVREDARVEVELLRTRLQRSPGEAAFCIGSGGCTSLALLACAPQKLCVVDVNPAQIFLIELKRAAFAHLSRREMLDAMQRDARPYLPILRSYLSDGARDFWDARQKTLAHGCNGCGVADRGLRLVARLLPMVQGRRTRTMFGFRDLAQQRRYYEMQWDNALWRAAFALALSRPVLRLAFGRLANHAPRGFPALMKARVDACFTDFPIRENPYLWQTFRARYSPDARGLPPFLRADAHNAIVANLPRMELHAIDALRWLEATPGKFGFFALSNILEVSTREFGSRLLEAVAHASLPGAIVCLRAIFPAQLPPSVLVADETLSAPARQLDRSPFCREIRVLRAP